MGGTAPRGIASSPSSPGVSQASDQVSQGWKLDAHALDTQGLSISAQGEGDRFRVTGVGRFYCGPGRKGLRGAGGCMRWPGDQGQVVSGEGLGH